MNQYIITEEQLKKITQFGGVEKLCIDSLRQQLADEIRSHPYQSERDKVLKLVADAIENQKDHKEFLLTRDQKDIVLDIIDGIRAELRAEGR
jgi:hypothetical protein